MCVEHTRSPTDTHSSSLHMRSQLHVAPIATCFHDHTQQPVQPLTGPSETAWGLNPILVPCGLTPLVVLGPQEWKGEMRGMAGRIERVRGELRASLESKYPDKDWSFITKQIGMFSFTGLTPAQASGQLRLYAFTDAELKSRMQQAV